MKQISIIAILAIALILCGCIPEIERVTPEISGTVTKSGKPVQAAKIYAGGSSNKEEQDLVAITDENGYFHADAKRHIGWIVPMGDKLPMWFLSIESGGRVYRGVKGYGELGGKVTQSATMTCSLNVNPHNDDSRQPICHYHDTGTTPQADVVSITGGPDGNVWFTERAGRIGKITPAGIITEYSDGIPDWALPNEITSGPDGNLWFTEEGSQIGKITPAGVIIEYSEGISSEAKPDGIISGVDNLWFMQQHDTHIWRMTLGGVANAYADIGGSSYLERATITIGPDNNLWFTDNTGNRIGKITPDGKTTQYGEKFDERTWPSHIVAGPDGNLWFVESGKERIGRITPSGTITEFRPASDDNFNPDDITAGPDGNLWFTDRTGHIGKITVQGAITEYTKGLSAKASPSRITRGPDGNLWFTDSNANQIGRITPNGVITEFSKGITPEF